MTHLQAIETRQRKSAVRDFLFALCVGAAALVAVSTVSTGASAAAVARR
jgi:hypothetical protein